MNILFSKGGLIILFIMISSVLSAQPNPYLQTPTPTSVYISWHSTDTSFTKVIFGLSASSMNQTTNGSFQDISGKFWHTVQLTGLSPATTYYYQCISGTDSSDVYPFRTQPLQPAPAQHLRFVILGDSRNDDTIPTYLPVVCQNIRETLISKFGTRWYDSVNLIFHTGDIVWNGTEIARFQDEYFTPMSILSCSVPVMVSIGNHEHESEIYFSYMKYTDFTDPDLRNTPLNQRFYSFNVLNCQFVILNSNTKLVGEHLQKSWLEKILAESDTASGTNLVFAFSHHPYHSDVWPRGNCDSVDIVFFRTFNKYSKVVQYSYGHTHCYEQGVFPMIMANPDVQHDLRLVLSGGGGAELSYFDNSSHNYPEIMKAVDDYCYMIMDVDVTNQSYTAEAYTLGKPDHPIPNLVFDSLHFRMNQPPPLQPLAYPVTDGKPLVLNSSPIQGADSCMTAEVQVTSTPGNYTSPVLDTLRNFENYYRNSGPPDYTPINLNAGINLYSLTVPDGRLNPSTVHGFRVRYRDMNMKWSPWSEEKTFNSSGIGDHPSMNADIILWQNYPNPFSKETLIRFTLRTAQQVTLTLGDIKGQEIMKLADGMYTSGDHTVTLSAVDHGLNPGLYILRMTGKSSCQVKLLSVNP